MNSRAHNICYGVPKIEWRGRPGASTAVANGKLRRRLRGEHPTAARSISHCEAMVELCAVCHAARRSAHPGAESRVTVRRCAWPRAERVTGPSEGAARTLSGGPRFARTKGLD